MRVAICKYFFAQSPAPLSLLPPVGSWPNTSQAVAVATAASLLQNGFGHNAMPPSVYPGLLSGRGKKVMNIAFA